MINDENARRLLKQVLKFLKGLEDDGDFNGFDLYLAIGRLEAVLRGKPYTPSKVKWVKDAPDHWRADIEGGHILSAWPSHSTGDWVWEVWPADRPNPDEPDFVDTVDYFSEAKVAAERCAKEQGLL